MALYNAYIYREQEERGQCQTSLEEAWMLVGGQVTSSARMEVLANLALNALLQREEGELKEWSEMLAGERANRYTDYLRGGGLIRTKEPTEALSYLESSAPLPNSSWMKSVFGQRLDDGWRVQQVACVKIHLGELTEARRLLDREWGSRERQSGAIF